MAPATARPRGGHKGYNSRAGAKQRARFDDGAAIGLAELKAAGLAKTRDVPVKILGRGELTKKFTVTAHKFSASARAAIEGAGGSVQVIED
jgi:large subunit ribosomal protein L15